jgi:hypothetical protein
VSNVQHEDYKSPTPKAETTTNRRGQRDFRKVLQLRLYVRYTFEELITDSLRDNLLLRICIGRRSSPTSSQRGRKPCTSPALARRTS